MANKKCLEGPCTQCTLCMKSNSKYTHPAQIRADKSTYDKLREFKPDVEDTACICLPCAKQLKRFATNPNLKAHPHWVPKSENASEKDKCSVENCKLYVYRSTNLASIENLEHLLGKRIVAFSIDQQQSSIGLCQSHYTCMYSQLHQASPCHSCGIIPIKDEPLTKHCPSSVEIHKYLTHITGEPSNLAQFVMVAIDFSMSLKQSHMSRLWKMNARSTVQRQQLPRKSKDSSLNSLYQ